MLVAQLGTVRAGKDIEVGEYRNLKLFIGFNDILAEHYFELGEERSIIGYLGKSGLANIKRMDKAISNIPELLRKAENDLRTTRDDFLKIQEQVNQPFEKEVELREKVIRLKQITTELNLGEEDLNIEEVKLENDHSHEEKEAVAFSAR